MTDEQQAPLAGDPLVAVVQARLDSLRFLRKVLSDLGGVPALQFLLQRLSWATALDETVVAVAVRAKRNDPSERLPAQRQRFVESSATS